MVDSIRTAALLSWSNQVSVKNKIKVKNKSRLCSMIKSLIKNVCPDKDLTFNKAKLNVLKCYLTNFLGQAVAEEEWMLNLINLQNQLSTSCFLADSPFLSCYLSRQDLGKLPTHWALTFPGNRHEYH